MDDSKTSGRKGLFPAVLIGLAVLLLWQVASAQPGADQKTIAEQAATWKTVIGNRYDVARPIDVHGSPSSRDTRDVAPGRTFTVTGLLSDPTDPSTAAYAIRLDSGGRVYIGAQDLHRLIRSGAVVSTGTVSDGSRQRTTGSLASAHGTQTLATLKEQPRATPLQVANLPRTYRTFAYHMSFHVSDALRGDFDLPMVLLVAGTVFGLVWALWHVMGCRKTLSFLAIFPLLHWLLLEFPGSVSLVPFLALLLLFANLLGVWTFVRFAITLAGFTAVAFVAHATYEAGNGTLITPVSLAVTALAGTVSLFLIRKTYGIERKLHQE